MPRRIRYKENPPEPPRVWGRADPLLLGQHDLTLEHRHTHELMKRGDTDQHKRFWKNRTTVSCLLMRHELIRLAMNYRWLGHHTSERHPSPIKRSLLLPLHLNAVKIYAKWVRDSYNQMVPRTSAPFTSTTQFTQLMIQCAFPLWDEDRDTPWGSRDLTLQEYLENSWKADRRFRRAQRTRGPRYS